MKFKIKSKPFVKLSMKQCSRIYTTGMKEAFKHPTLVRLLAEDYTDEEADNLVDTFTKESEEVSKLMERDYPKMPRKTKLRLKRKLSVTHNAYAIASILLLMRDEL